MEKELKTVSIDGLEEIGRGMTSRVYKLDEDKVIKVFYPGIAADEIEAERIASRLAFIKDIPVPITYQLVRVSDGYGIIYELVEADTLAGTIGKAPELLSEYAIKAAKLLQKLHNTKYAEGELPDIRQAWWHLCTIGLNKFISDEESEKLQKFLFSLPTRNTFIHGDYHAFNILVRSNELILIDVGDASLGHPIFDLASVYMANILIPEGASEERRKQLILSPEQFACFFDVFISTYFDGDDDKKNRITEVIKRLAALRLCITHALIPGKDDDERIAFIRPKMEKLLLLMDDTERKILNVF